MLGLKRAVVYLRVSSAAQVNTDYDPEGLSIPAQRESCYRKARQMADVEKVDEYVEPGRTGTTMESRPAFQAMLQRIREQRDIDYFIIYKLSRMNRNRIDDALVGVQLRKYGVTLVSATEMIDETPEGQLMHGILASFNEFRSSADGADIRYKMGEKAKRGGTLGRAPLGYCNVREIFDGREIRTVSPDPERAPFVRQAFELYATGEYTLAALCDELTNRGLRTRPGRHAAGRLSDSKLCSLLRDRYYLGIITYKGEEFPGRHEPLVDPELFEAVQEVLASHKVAGERQRVHHHYLKGSIWCGACKANGRESRLIVQRAVGGSGKTYFYFFCSAKQQRLCDEPYTSIEATEEAIERHYRKLSLAPEFTTAVQDLITATLADERSSARLLKQQLATQLAKLDRQEENMLDLVADGTLASGKVKSRLNRITSERAQLIARSETSNDRLEAGAAALTDAMRLLENPARLYETSDDHGRRLVNQAIFEKLYIQRGEVTADELRDHVKELVHLDRTLRCVNSVDSRHDCDQTERDNAPVAALARRLWPVDHRADADPICCRPLQGTETLLLATALAGGSSSKGVMVELWGIEPQTSSMPWKRSTN